MLTLSVLGGLRGLVTGLHRVGPRPPVRRGSPHNSSLSTATRPRLGRSALACRLSALGRAGSWCSLVRRRFVRPRPPRTGLGPAPAKRQGRGLAGSRSLDCGLPTWTAGRGSGVRAAAWRLVPRSSPTERGAVMPSADPGHGGRPGPEQRFRTRQVRGTDTILHRPEVGVVLVECDGASRLGSVCSTGDSQPQIGEETHHCQGSRRKGACAGSRATSPRRACAVDHDPRVPRRECERWCRPRAGRG